MNVLDRAASNFANRRNLAGSTSVLGGSFFGGIFGMGGAGATLKPVSQKRALQLSAVWNSVDIISNAIGIVPFGVFQTTDDGRERLKDHPVDWLLNHEPDGADGFLTAFSFKKMTGLSLLLRGNCLYKIKLKRNGDITLKYIAWDDVTDIKKITDANGDTVLAYIIKGGDTLLAHEVLHFKGLSFDGIVGLSVIQYACLNMNIAIEVQNFSYTNFESKGVRQGVIETDKIIGGSNVPTGAPARTEIKNLVNPDAEIAKKETGKRAIIAGWRAAMGEKSADRVVVLDEGMKYKPLAITPQEAQIIEQGRFSIEDIARWFNIAPHKIKSLQQSTNNNIEQQSLDFLSDTVQPWVTNIEQEFAKKLLERPERIDGVYVKGNMNVLLRSDMKARAEYYSKMLNGIMTTNEIRELEELNKKEGGDEIRYQVNTQTDKQAENDGKE